MKINELKALLEKEQAEVKDLSAVNELLDEVIGGEPKEEQKEEPEEPSEEPSEEPEEPAEEPAEEPEEPSEEPAEEPKDEPEAIDLSVIIDGMTELKAQIAELKAQLTDSQAKLAESEKKLSAKVAAEKEFIEKFKTLSAVVREEKKPEKMPTIGMTNGIGEG